MRTVTLEIDNLEAGLDAFGRAWKTGQAESDARISFASPELLWKVMTAKRWELLKALAGQEPMSVRAAARAVGRDVKAVHGDIQALISAGIVSRTDDGKIVFPFDAVHVDFMLNAGRAA
jgi:predicted transcriptional regulator